MTIFLILAPFGAFAALILVTSAAVSLLTSAAIWLAVITFDVYRGRSIKILGAGSVILFGALGCYIALVEPSLSVSAIKLTVDAGVFAISLLSLALRRPFTLQYALEMVDPATAKLPGFMTANYIITWAWTGAFLLMMMANILMIYVPSLPLWSGIVIVFAARNSAAYFTKWYPQYRKAKYAPLPASGGALSSS
jgi:intracellular septation protein A